VDSSISNNRPEWNFIDMGMSQIGVIPVSIYPTISTEEYDYMNKNSFADFRCLKNEIILQ